MASEQVVGVIGGMGPEAALDFCVKLLRADVVEKESDHLHVILDNDPRVPDRSAAIAGTGPDPAHMLVKIARGLLRSGATVLAMPCNTAHAWYGEVARAVNVPFPSIIEATCNAAGETLPEGARAGILATDGTLFVEMYQEALAARGIIPLVPEEELQQEVMRAVYGIKRNGVTDEAREVLRGAAAWLVESEASTVILGCTEVSLALKQNDCPVRLVDSTAALASAVVAIARGNS